MYIYVVEPGDTIYSIAEQFQVDPALLAKINGINNPDLLAVGQAVVVIDSPLVPETEKLGDISINGYAYTYIDRDVLRQTLPNLTFISLFTYGFSAEGDLVPLNDDELLGIVEEYETRPLMVISSLSPEGAFSNVLASAMLNNEEAQDRLIDNILINLEQKNYYGLDIDFEYVYPSDRDAFIAFVAKTAGRLNAQGYPVFTALAPKTRADQPGLLYEAHDYYAIGRVSNYVLLMTYEWGYTYGPPMAVAPIDKVRQVLDYAVTEIPPEKIYMGIPNYGYDWTLPFVRGESRARSLGNVEAAEQAARYGAVIQFDETAQTPFYYYTDEEGREHVVWFEDARSIDAKLRLVAEYGFQGAGYWNIMRYFPQNWVVANQLYNIRKME